MISRYRFDNAWYGDQVLPSRVRAFVRGNKDSLLGITTSEYGNLALPTNVFIPEQLLFLRVYYSGLKYQFIAGKGHKSGKAWLYNGTKWNNLGITFGNSPLAFFNDRIYIVRDATSVDVYNIAGLDFVETRHQQIGTQGIRWIEDEIIHTGDETYNGSHIDEIKLAEWTKLGPYYIGQSYIDGCVITDTRTKVRKLIEPGDTTFIRSYKFGSDFSVTIVKALTNQVLFVEFNELDIPLLVDESIIVPPTESKPKPKPKPKPNDMIDHKDIVKNLATTNSIDNISAESILKFTELVVKFLSKVDGAGFLLKPGGENIALHDGKNVSISRVCYPDGHIYKILSDAGAGGTNGPQWVDNGFTSPNSYLAFIDNDSESKPNPNPTSDNSKLEARVLELESLVNSLASKMIKSGDNITLQTKNGLFVCAEGSGNSNPDNSVLSSGNVNATRTSAGSWEAFKLVKN